MIPIPTTARDINAVNRVLRQIRIKAADNTFAPIIRRPLANTSNSTIVSNTTAETNYSVNRVITKELMLAGHTVQIHAAGIYSNSGAGTHTLRFRVKFGSTNMIVFSTITITGTNSNVPWMVDAKIAIKTTGSSGTARSSAIASVVHGGATPTISQDVQVDASDVAIDTISDETVQVSVVHGVSNTDTTSTLVNLLVDVLK